ncbi:hypothetical protein Q7P37_010598 [Cladosporium fusiforme]
MDRNTRRDDRGGRRDEPRIPKPRNERERSRSPYRERRDDRRRSRSPPRGSRNGPSQRYDRDHDRPGQRNQRDRQTSHTPEPSRAAGGRGPPRGQQHDNRSNGADSRSGKQVGGKQEAGARDVQMGNGVEDEDSEAEMARVMGFKDFRSTKNTKVPGNDKNYAVSKVKKAEYRQYMNRVGGFNRPLSPGRG